MTIDARADERPEVERPPVLAAGGIVLTTTVEGLHVLVVHRPAHSDWSLPKGHVEAGEEVTAAALREVHEETGVAVVVTGDAGTTEYRVALDGAAAQKRVHWFTMRPDASDGDPFARAATRTPDAEVDRAEWWPVERALRALTHASDRDLLRRTALAA